MEYSQDHKACFVHIVGAPNTGKSTLLNYFVRYPLSITTHKAQTTRHNILGIHNEKDLQIVYVDTPGILDPAYELQKAMMRNVERALLHSDILLWIIDIRNIKIENRLKRAFQKHSIKKKMILLNKIDLLQHQEIENSMKYWNKEVPDTEIIPISARYKAGLSFVEQKIKNILPVHPPYYPKDNLTDKSERFFIADIIRKQIFLFYKQEIPYCTEVQIKKFRNDIGLLWIEATIYVEHERQCSILIGKNGSCLKKVGIAARKEIVHLYKKKVFLSQKVKVSPNWRKKEKQLNAWGYQ